MTAEGPYGPLIDTTIRVASWNLWWRFGPWEARQPGGYTLRYVFRRDGTFEHTQGTRQKRRGGTYLFEIRTRGTMRIRDDTLVLRPRSGTQVRRDPADPKGDYRRPGRPHGV